MCSFNENDYQLSSEDKVKIVKEKVFKVQNYYNYLYELETKKKVSEVNEKIQSIIKLAQEEKIKHKY